MLARDALDIELLAHAVRMEGSLALGLRALYGFFVKVHDFLAYADGLELGQKLATRFLLVCSRIASHEALAEEKVVGAFEWLVQRVIAICILLC